MARAQRFEELIAWQKSRTLAMKLRPHWSAGPMARDFGLSDQLRRSSRSTMANIAEGFGRAGAREFHRFLSNAAGSNAETQSHLYVAFDCRYITETELNELLADTEEVARLIRAL